MCYVTDSFVQLVCFSSQKSVVIYDTTEFDPINQSINPILIWVYPCKRGWPDLPHSNGNLSNSHSPSRSIQGFLPLQTNTPALLLRLSLPHLPWSSSPPLALNFKLPCSKKLDLSVTADHCTTVFFHV